MANIKNCVEEISQSGFEEAINHDITVVDFFAEWCMPCLMMTPIVEEMAEKFKKKIEFCKVNIDDNSELTDKYDVMSVPTFIVFKKGKEVDRIVGGMSAELFEEKLRALVK